ncbi:hypothetical protein [Ktedonospora formicarum]|uniref:Phospholipid/glycerol acyltransferase domain-containing protein n=1 Tax=Ktedonospora formicarum TaxID=2778364 RepID=A0A8J3I4I1_9CHLR|nr:hypothetical protein [Ktedonospora formicarum]GHO46545.1 hypothetical protein KSX_47080 [Ktedonospora formicarum]
MKSQWWPLARSPRCGIMLGVLPRMRIWQASWGEKRAAWIANSIRAISHRVVKIGALLIVSLGVYVRVEGLDHVPAHGPLLIVARHYHHLYDGSILLRTLSRRLRIFVALDWVGSRWQRMLIEQACAALTWPVILRGERLRRRDAVLQYKADEVRSYLRRAMQNSVMLLCQQEALLIFPEAYPNIDPSQMQKLMERAFFPSTQVLRV